MRYYGRTKKHPCGTPEDPFKCVVEVKDRFRSSGYHQCTYPRMPGSELCSIHFKHHHSTEPPTALAIPLNE